ncbi:hypothetical protein LS70_002300 [Helicobacter sp. MIT 11-5569]|uniref:hypothetical protein n=1 Tax=Helicobacter sp. MIT 11-5569 TaxID=1548151 RepID=UPI00051FD162|nr:hypothetical protein [Helicobacter sp. MIT 11-5569]TLD84401.1 hypothetical protein LS70_002300 [Helicobacter sp. MIT 11-5569]
MQDTDIEEWQNFKLQKTSKNLDIIKKAKVLYGEEENSYNVLFFSELEKKDFCAQFGICQ